MPVRPDPSRRSSRNESLPDQRSIRTGAGQKFDEVAVDGAAFGFRASCRSPLARPRRACHVARMITAGRRTARALLFFASAIVVFAEGCDGTSTQDGRGDIAADASETDASGPAARSDGGSDDANADAPGKPRALPTALRQSSAVDGNQPELVRDVAVDAQGNVYVTGGTQSPNFVSLRVDIHVANEPATWVRSRARDVRRLRAPRGCRSCGAHARRSPR